MSSDYRQRPKVKDIKEAAPTQILDLEQSTPAVKDETASSAGDLSNILPLQSSYGNAAVAQTVIQRKESEGQSETSNATPKTLESTASPTAVRPAIAPSRSLIVEDDLETIEPGQMKKSQFLTELRAGVCDKAAEGLAGTVWSAVGCPYIEKWFAHYGAQSSDYIETAVRRYAPESAGSMTAGDYIRCVVTRIDRSVKTWATTGKITGVPPGVNLPSSDDAGGDDSAEETSSGGGEAGSGNLFFKTQNQNHHQQTDPNQVRNQLGAGQPLDGEIRTTMESAFGESFSGVRLHTDSNAAKISSNLNARALTVGDHIAFGASEYQPGNPIGQALIAHELAHVLQQRGAGTASGPMQKGQAGSAALEEDADQAAVAAVMSGLGQAKKSSTRIGTIALARLKSGLRLQRCKKTSKGPMGAKRLADARTNFQDENDHLTGDELARIDAALAIVTRDNINLWITFYDYYSKLEINKMSAAATAAAKKRGLYAETKPDDDTVVRPDILDAGFPPAKLGTTLIHEYTHTRHDTNYMGTRDYQEGESYGIEYFLAERSGESTRLAEITNVMSNPTTLTIPAQVPALITGFRAQYATMRALYEIIDTGSSSYAGSPFVTPTTLTVEEARALVTELVSSHESDHGAKLKSILRWVKANLNSFKKMPI